MNNTVTEKESLLHRLWFLARKNPLSLISLGLFGFYVFIALTANYWVPFDPLKSNTAIALEAPNISHWFGTDHLGRDVFSRVMVATRLDLGIAFTAVAISFVIGTALGSMVAYFGGWYERIICRVGDIVLAFPLFVLAMGIVAVMGNSLINVIYATAIINIPFYIRIARAEVSLQRDRQYVQVALLSGNSHMRTLLHHIFPNCLPNLVVQISTNMGWAILNRCRVIIYWLRWFVHQSAEWGILVAEGADYIISGQWWLVLFPGFILMLAVFSFNLLGDTLRDLVDPQKGLNNGTK
ncbi:ABC transporter permease [Psychromonas sp. KJ10-10]|uniref:ABC transporter permease n=1 Tax=Psychromonas sp. KJ10-10 TaxID=3391823 RepID=UPI0039B36CB4